MVLCYPEENNHSKPTYFLTNSSFEGYVGHTRKWISFFFFPNALRTQLFIMVLHLDCVEFNNYNNTITNGIFIYLLQACFFSEEDLTS